MWKNHPRALPFLFFSEMWERFGYYLMIGIFTLYLKDVKTGYGMTEAESADLYGTFIALVFFTPFLGGLIADRYLGYRRSIIIGGLMMGTGYCLMAVHDITMLYVSMTLVIAGNGFFKPNISTLLGNVYATPAYMAQKDEGYNIFYMGINIGAFICNFFGAALYVMMGWSHAFIAAGIGMFIGVAVFLAGTKHYAAFDIKKGVQPTDMAFTRIVLLILLPSVIAGAAGWILPGLLWNSTLFGSPSTDAFIFACLPVIYFYISLYAGAAREEKRPILALLAIFAVVILFWAVFKQNGSALNTWADRYTNREVKGAPEKIFETLRLSQQIAYTKDSVPLYDEQFRLQKVNNEIIRTYDYPSYFKNVNPERLPQPGSSISVWATNLSQSINPGWVIIFTPLILAFFTWLRKKNKEPSTATKIAWGLFISALSALVMAGAVYASSNGTEKAGAWWLIASYGVITIGELFLSPMGLSIVSKLSPSRITALMMGGWFLSTSIGNKLSGVLATMWDDYDHKANYFWLNFALLIAAAAACFAMLRWLNAILKEKGIH
ncbi:MAG TPA: peptide MFS transporter [Agriterribacter sp.]|nr:peptide MFS transporter [Agriterribacter sp.]